MDVNVERECSALGGLFHQIITDMKNGAPLWEDLILKATKLHVCLRAAILAVSAYLEAFQKIADAATNTRGATKEIGTALTRICLRHKAVETRMKSFTCTIMDRLVMPLQEKLEDWKKTLINLDKEHAKEYKKAKSEIKKRSTDTLRLQKKKTRKGIIPNHGISLEETEKKAVRAALLEERGRFCEFAKFLKPVLDEEILMLMELTHLQEVSEQLERHVSSPFDLPAAFEQVITDLKGCDNIHWTVSTPPSSPSLSLGSRKSSICSISSLTSSSSGSCKNLCGHPCRRSLSQTFSTRPMSIACPGSTTALRNFSRGNSRDSGFTSQDTLYNQPISEHKVSNVSFQSSQSNNPIKTNSTNSTWPDLQQTTIMENQNQQTTINERPHTISSTYEKGHQRPALSVYTFQAPDTDCCHSQPVSPVSSPSSNLQLTRLQSRKNSVSVIRPPIPSRCSSLERPSRGSSSGNTSSTKTEGHGSRSKAKLPIPAHLAKELGNNQLTQQPMYVNMHELANLAVNKAHEMHIPAAVPTLSTASEQHSLSSTNDKTEIIVSKKDGACSQTSESSSGYGSQTILPNSSSILKQNEAVGLFTVPRRSSIDQRFRPMPPTRRTSQMISSNVSNTSEPFVGVTEGVLAATDSNRSDMLAVTIPDETENLPPPPAFLLEGNSPGASPTPKRSMSVSETVRTLTELRHTPASPSLLRKSSNQPQQSSNSSTGIVTQITTCSQTSRRVSTSSESTSSASGQNQSGVGGVGQGFMAVLSAKLINNSNVNLTTGYNPKAISKHINTNITNKNQRTPVGLLETLSAKLSAKQQQQQSQLLQNPSQINIPLQVMTNEPIIASSRSASVRRIMANRIPIIDQNQVRGSLMDQIRRGTSLKKTTGPINDRSAPKIYYA